MGLAIRVNGQARVRLEPPGALGAVVAAQPGQVLGGLGLLVQLQVSGGLEVGLDLVDVAGGMSVERGERVIWSVQMAYSPSPPPGFCLGALCEDAHGGGRGWNVGEVLLCDQRDPRLLNMP